MRKKVLRFLAVIPSIVKIFLKGRLLNFLRKKVRKATVLLLITVMITGVLPMHVFADETDILQRTLVVNNNPSTTDFFISGQGDIDDLSRKNGSEVEISGNRRPNITINVTGGTKENPHLIFNAEQLKNIGRSPSVCYQLRADIDLNNEEWIPIVSFYGSLDGNGYKISNLKITNSGENKTGLFRDTTGATLTNIVIENVDVQGKDYTGALVGRSYNTVVENCRLEGNISILGDQYVGGFIGQSSGGCTIENNKATGDIAIGGRFSVGGFVGSDSNGAEKNSKVTNNSIDGNVEVVGNQNVGGMIGNSVYGTINNNNLTGYIVVKGSGSNVGGLLGSLNGGEFNNNSIEAKVMITGGQRTGGMVGVTISGTNMVNNNNIVGEIKVEGTSMVGGLIGELVSTCEAQDNYVKGYLEVTGTREVGGLVGVSKSDIISCFVDAVGNIEGQVSIGGLVGNMGVGKIESCKSNVAVEGGDFVGGLAGQAPDIIESYATGKVKSDKKMAGGLVGRSKSIIKSYATGDVEFNGPENYSVGSLAGYIIKGGLIENCFSLGEVRGEVRDVFVLLRDENVTILNSFTTSEKGAVIVAGSNHVIANLYYGKDESMLDKDTYIGFDFENIWDIDEGSYPYLRELDKPEWQIVLTNSIVFDLPNYTVSIPNANTSDNQIVVNATVLDENSNPIEEAHIVYSLAEDYEGISIDSTTGMVTVTPQAVVGTVIITATSGTSTTRVNLVLTENTLGNIVFGLESYASFIPTVGAENIVLTVNAIVLASDEQPVLNAPIAYSLAEDYEGISIDSATGVVTITSNAIAGTVVIAATFDDLNTQVNLILTSKSLLSGNQTQILAEVGRYYDITVAVNQVTDFNNMEITLTYDANIFELEDISSLTKQKELTVGSINEIGITVTSISAGEIKFKADKNITSGKAWSGILNVVRFKAHTTGEGMISVTQ